MAEWDPAEHPRDPDTGRFVRVFAFGSNLDPGMMEARAPGSVPVGPAMLGGHVLEFPSGLPNVRRTSRGQVPGYLYDVPESSMSSLDRHEGTPDLYKRDELTVSTPGGRDRAHVYRMPDAEAGEPEFRVGGLYDLTRSGRQHWGLPTDDLAPPTARVSPNLKIKVYVNGMTTQGGGSSLRSAAEHVATALRANPDAKIEVRSPTRTLQGSRFLTQEETNALADEIAAVMREQEEQDRESTLREELGLEKAWGPDDERKHPRDPTTGEWTDDPVHVGLPVLEWEDPPAPRGVPGARRAGGFSASGRTATEQGDLGELIMERFGLWPVTSGRQGALDATGEGWGYEIKTRTVQAVSYRVGMRTKEMKQKRAEARRLGLKPALVVVVMDEKGGRAWVYHRPGLRNGLLARENGFSFAGRVEL